MWCIWQNGKNNGFQKLILKAHIVKFRESEAITFDILKYFNVEYNFIENIKISYVINALKKIQFNINYCDKIYLIEKTRWGRVKKYVLMHGGNITSETYKSLLVFEDPN